MVLTALLAALATHHGGEPLVPLVDQPDDYYLARESYVPGFPQVDRYGDLILSGWARWAYVLWRQALKEENFTWANETSFYARQMVKFPRSWVGQLRRISHRHKRHDFNFVGRPGKNRDWAMDFAQANFSSHDVFEFTGPEVQKWVNYKRRGPWDWTMRNGPHSVTRAVSSREYGFDLQYFQTMCFSNFTLCPAGDHPYAMRFIDAIAAGSIPVVRSVTKDVDSPYSMLTSIPFHYYALEDGVKPVFRQDWVDENTELFIKYCTFVEGDNTPPDWTPPTGMKEAIEAAEAAWPGPPERA